MDVEEKARLFAHYTMKILSRFIRIFLGYIIFEKAVNSCQRLPMVRCVYSGTQ